MGAVTLEVVGRDEELAAVDSFLGADAPATLLIEGEAGIGKTTIWQHGVEAARADGQLVLAARPTSSEAPLSFAGLGDLLVDVPEELLDELPEPQRRALRVALLLDEGTDAEARERAIGLGLVRLLTKLGHDGRLLIALDDVQWLDRPSAVAISFALRRLRDTPVRVLLARRPGSNGEHFERIPGATTLQLSALSIGATQHLIRTRLGEALPRPRIVRIHEASGGNPFYALELARALLARGLAGGGDLLPVPDDLDDLVAHRLAQLGPEALRALAALAALARPTLSALVSALGADASERLAAAEAAGIVEIRGDDVRFGHPLFGTIVYARLRPDERRALHARLAAVAEDLEERARHIALAASAPSEEVACLLESAALAARGRGGVAAAAELAEKSYRMTPTTARDAVSRRGVLAFELHMDSGELPRAESVVADLVCRNPPPWALARALNAQAVFVARSRGYVAAIPLWQQALPLTDDPFQQCCLRLDLAQATSVVGALTDAFRHAEAGLAAAEMLGEPLPLWDALATVAVAEAELGNGFRRDLYDRAKPLLHWNAPSFQEAVYLTRGVGRWADVLAMNDDLEAARELLLAGEAYAAENGHEPAQTLAFIRLAEVHLLAGDWDDALTAAGRADDAAAPGLVRQRLGAALAAGTVLGHRGELATARVRLAEARSLCEQGDTVRSLIAVRAAAGSAELAAGNDEAAWEELRSGLDLFEERGYGDPARGRLHADAVEAALAVGQVRRATELTDWLEVRGHELDRPWALAVGGRCRALLLAEAGELESAVPQAELALRHHERLPMPFERGRTLLVLGRLLRRVRRRGAARAALDEATAIFSSLGARPWIERAQSEAARIGGRTAEKDELTATERRVAELVARGRTNKEAAAELFVTVRAIEANLTRIYAKLGVRSRTELAARLTEPQT